MTGRCRILYRAVLALCVAGAGLNGAAPQEDDDARERLIRKGRGEAEADVMDRILAGMTQIETALTQRFDIGADTRSEQQRVMTLLDEAIATAKQNLQVTQSQPPPDPEGRGDDRPDAEPAPDAADQESTDAARDGVDPHNSAPGAEERRRRLLGELLDGRRQWGNLPPRDRDEVLQGIDEDIHDAFVDQVNRYYEALGTTDEE